MSFCPKCGTEFRVGFNHCPDCEADLVDDPPPEIPEDYEDADWIELYTFPGNLYAQMAVELLNREGLPAYSISGFAGAGLGVTGGSDFVGANAIVYVLDPDYETAMEIIEPMVDELPGTFNGEFEEEDE